MQSYHYRLQGPARLMKINPNTFLSIENYISCVNDEILFPEDNLISITVAANTTARKYSPRTR